MALFPAKATSRYWVLVSLACVTATQTTSVAAEVVVDTLGGPYTSAYFIHQFSIDDLQHAEQFTPTTALRLESVAMAIAARHNSQQQIEISLAADAQGVPGVPLETWTLSNLPMSSTTTFNEPPVLIPSATFPLLLANTSYWITARQPTLGNLTDVLWFTNSRDLRGTAAARGSGYPPGWNAFNNQMSAAYQVVAAPIPEPSALALSFLAALCGPGLYRRGV